MNIKKAIQITKIKIQYRSYFKLAQKTHKNGEKLLRLLNKNINQYPKGAKKLCIVLYTQTVRLLQAIVLLCNEGLDEEAGILTRSLVDNAAYLLFIAEETHEDRAELYSHSRALSEALAVKEINSMTPRGEKKVDEKFFSERKSEAFKYFRNKYGQDKTEKDIKEKYTLKPRNAGEQIKGEVGDTFKVTYGILHRPVSSVTHAEAPLSFVMYKNNKLSLKKWTVGKSTKIFLETSIVLMLYVIDSLTELLNIKETYQTEILSAKLSFLFKQEGLIKV